MVRIKHRYLLFNILYPTPTTSASPSSSTAPPDNEKAYIHFSRPSPSHLNTSLLLSLIRSSITFNFGTYFAALTAPALRLVYFSARTSTGILRVPRAHAKVVWASLTMMDTIPIPSTKGGPSGSPIGEEVKCVLQVVRVSGTIRKSEEEVLRRARREVARARRDVEEEDQRVLDGLVGGGSQHVSDSTRFMRGEEEGIEDDDEAEEDVD
ncbi:uncharacterized protein Z518_03074 [Rhinocladiella mackenziei CBS 650.93]|uniref:Ribonuclease P/MRP protein subunit POP5 n=1 Tax=Rhinocladiella mackenziei CBS 650.93 TaxID=1442369 RepID=A0A0D2HD66_9EURO|nr:uncharacterized protein Z518_03074 [Rhinocladiella mackenziei CBS 650.93]KIX08418.1 hypothetical protein Z518_03074 [Rhinocladiella mackenziei CBS 650.93]